MATQQTQTWPWVPPDEQPFTIHWEPAADPITNDKWMGALPNAAVRKGAKKIMTLLVKKTAAECEFLESARIMSGLHDTSTLQDGTAVRDGPHITVQFKHARHAEPFSAHIYISLNQWREPDNRYPNHTLGVQWHGWALGWKPGMPPVLPIQPTHQGPGNAPGGGGNGGGGNGGGGNGGGGNGGGGNGGGGNGGHPGFANTGSGGFPQMPTSLPGGGHPTKTAYSAYAPHNTPKNQKNPGGRIFSRTPATSGLESRLSSLRLSTPQQQRGSPGRVAIPARPRAAPSLPTGSLESRGRHTPAVPAPKKTRPEPTRKKFSWFS